jgi:hypothetical protein
MKTQREKLLILIVPSLAVLAIYVNWFAMPLQKDIDNANNQLNGLKSKVGSPVVLVQKGARLVQLNNEVKQLQEQQVELERDWKTLAGVDGPRSPKIEQLTDLLRLHGLSVIEQTLETGKDGTVSVALDPVVKRMGDRKPQLWRFRVRGTYASMFQALKELTKGEPAVTPLGLTMKEAPLYSDVREWSLMVWI